MQGFPTRAEVEAGLEAYNDHCAEVWRARLSELQTRLSKAGRDLERREVGIEEIEGIRLELSSPPRLEFEGATSSAGGMKVVLALPGSGSWNVAIRARLRLPPQTGRGHLVEVHIRRLRAVAEIQIDRHSPIEASLVDSQVRVQLEDIEVDGAKMDDQNSVHDLAFFLDAVKDLVEKLIRGALRGSLPNADALLHGQRELLPATPPPSAPDTPLPLDDLEDAARQISRRIHDHHLPFGLVLNSATPTGHFLAGEIYRHKVTQDPQALENIKKGLDGFRRWIHPADDAGRRSLRHVTGEEYMGAFLGLGWVALRVGDEELRAEAREIVHEMIRHLVDQHFRPSEATADPQTGMELTSATFLLNPAWTLAVLQFARRLDAKKYSSLYERFYPMWSVQWVFQWLRSLDPRDADAKFKVEHASALILLALEDEPRRHARLALGFRMVRQAVKNHHFAFSSQAFFNLVELETLGNNPDLLSRPREELNAEAQHLLDQAFKQMPDSPTPDSPTPRSPNVDLTLPFWIARKVGL